MSTLGPRGLGVLSIAGIAGICLGALGWTQRGIGQVTASPTASASSAYQVWPGPPTPNARLAMSGLLLKVTSQANGITVIATQDGQKISSVSHFYPRGAKVYVLHSNRGDDDGLVVTNAQGQVLP